MSNANKTRTNTQDFFLAKKNRKLIHLPLKRDNLSRIKYENYVFSVSEITEDDEQWRDKRELTFSF